MLLPALGQATEEARRISCYSNIKGIGFAIRMYAQEYHGQFPDKNGAEGLEMLRAGGYLENGKMYTCPSTDTSANDGDKLTEKTVSYVYVGGLNESSPPNAVLMYDKPCNHLKYGNVLYADGHVQGFAGAKWMAEAEK